MRHLGRELLVACPLAAALFVAGLVSAPAPAVAQTVQGELREGVHGEPVRGVLVVLMDDEERVRAGTLSDEEGRFSLRAPGPGAWTLKAERLGFATLTLPPMTLAEGDEEFLALELATQVISLEGIAVMGESRCTVRPTSGLPAHALWEQARRALFSVAVVQEQELVEYDVHTFHHEFQRRQGQPRTLASDTTTVRGRPFESFPAEALVREGFAVGDGDGIILYAPDAQVLLSDAFLDSHCLYVEAGPEGGTDRVGLGFEPMEGHPVPGIAGVVWLDVKSGALQEVEYVYTEVPLLGILDRAGGRIEFRELEHGGWIVQRWRVRTVHLGGLMDWDGLGELPESFLGYEESGGEVMEVRRTGLTEPGPEG